MEAQYQEFYISMPLNTTKKVKKNLSREPGESTEEIHHAIALVGDQFYKGKFFPASELEKAAPKWNGTLHDINHMGTTYINGFMSQANILYFVGWQDNVKYNTDTKSVSMDIHPRLDTQYGKAWEAFVNLNKEAGNVTNVSISFAGKTKFMKASELPKGVDYSTYGYSDDDYVECIYDVIPRALSTVLTGACSDKDGCGITHSSKPEDDDDNETKKQLEIEKQKLITWLKENE